MPLHTPATFTDSAAARCHTADGQDLHFLGMHAQGQLQGCLLHMQLQQSFRNPGRSNVEVTYTCPLPWGAVLLGVDVVLNGQPLHGSVVGQQQARERYETALDQGHSSILVSINPDGTLSMELGNLLAQEECQITLRYAQSLLPVQGSLRCTLPTTIAPRYGDAVHDGGYAPHLAPHSSLGVEYPFSISIRIEGDLARAVVSSPSHSLRTRHDNGACVLGFAGQAWLDRDLVLLLDELPATSLASVALDTQAENDADGPESLVMAWLHPCVDQQAALFPRTVQSQILVDCSGSMRGESIASARRALQQIVHQLQDEDRFSLSKFGSLTAHCHRRMVSASSAQKLQATDWIAELQADMGGTEMQSAISSTLGLQGSEGSDMLLVTDGEIHAIDALLQQVQHQQHRIFVVGIGSSPAEAHLQRLAQATGGCCEWVAPGEAVEPAIVRMFQRLRSPVIRRLELQMVAGTDPQPAPLRTPLTVLQRELLTSHCFAGDQVLAQVRLAGAWPATGAAAAELQLWGHLDGAEQPLLLARMAAHAQCQRYENDQRRPQSRQWREQRIRQLALRYQLVTPYTHFVLVHERDAATAPLDLPALAAVPNMQAAGWSGAGHATSSPCIVLHEAPEPMAFAAYSAPAMPSVWRASREAASAHMLQSHAHEADDLEIPAFLRPGADRLAASRTAALQAPRELSPEALASALQLYKTAQMPRSLQRLHDLGLPAPVVQWLQSLVDLGHDETAVVHCFIAALLKKTGGLFPRCRFKASTPIAAVLEAMQALNKQHWPASMQASVPSAAVAAG